ncbi:hypothetical protein [Pseudomonas aeruginosa]|uniref:hypothetical protein n=1 Tax=Pseudomonas aeruginosa TaxID=287 RepID=UPI003CF1BE62
MSKELNKALDLLREIRPSIPKDVLELWCKDRDAFLAQRSEFHQHLKECADEVATWPTYKQEALGPFLGHELGIEGETETANELNKAPVEQAGGDEREAFEAWATHLPWEAWQARAALAPELELPASCGPMPEINYANYGEDEVKALQDWAFAATDELTAFDRITEKQQKHIEWLAASLAKWIDRAENWSAVNEAAQARVAELERVLRVVVNAADHGSWPTTVMHGIEKVREVLAGSAPPVKAQPEETPGEILAAKLIETWVTKHGKPAPWSTAVEITALATNMPNDERDRLLALDDDVDAQAQHSVPERLELTDDLKNILGRPNFTCTHLAQALRQIGFVIDRKAEAEQAACLHWMLNHYLANGANWKVHAEAELKAAAPGKEGV